jgi:NADPH:quinone reductase-like Zn-dependent oxidoreductase
MHAMTQGEPLLYPEVLRASTEIACSASSLYEFLKNFENYEKWFPGIVLMRSANTLPHGTIGKRYDEIAWVPPGKEEKITVELVAAELNTHIAIHASLHPFYPRFDYRIETLSENTVRFHWLCRARGHGLKAWLGRPIMRRVLRPRLNLAMQRLKALMENDSKKLMRAVHIRRFGSAVDTNIFTSSAFRPVVKDHEILIEMRCASINHIDVQRRKGYGAKVFALKKAGQWPITLGTDFSGRVVAVGSKVSQHKVGDEVFGAKPPSADGTFAQYVAVHQDHAIPKPASMNWQDAAAIPYAYLTAWAALVDDGQLVPGQAQGKRVYVQGGAGAVGLMAAQIAKAWGAYVAVSCTREDVPFANSKGFDLVIDRNEKSQIAQLKDFDLSLCTADPSEMPLMLGLLRSDAQATFVTVVHPTLRLIDEFGIFKGIIKGMKQRKALQKSAASQGKRVMWTLFKPSAAALQALLSLWNEHKIQARIDSIYPLQDLTLAQEKLEQGLARGKVMIDLTA